MSEFTSPAQPDLPASGAEHYENLAPSLWNPLGSALVSAADLLPGETVVDACAGAGSSALPAAQEVGASGRVVAIDLSEGLIERTREKALTLGLTNLECVVDDVAAYTPEQPVDAVLMGLGIFLLPDPQGVMSHIRGYVRPGGRFTLSTWAQPGLEPLLEPLLAAVHRHNPVISSSPRPDAFARLERASKPEELRSDLLEAGFSSVETGEIHLRISMDEALLWDFVLGTSLRRLLSASDPEINRRIRADFAEQSLTHGFLEFAATVDLHTAYAPEA